MKAQGFMELAFEACKLSLQGLGCKSQRCQAFAALSGPEVNRKVQEVKLALKAFLREMWDLGTRGRGFGGLVSGHGCRASGRGRVLGLALVLGKTAAENSKTRPKPHSFKASTRDPRLKLSRASEHQMPKIHKARNPDSGPRP